MQSGTHVDTHADAHLTTHVYAHVCAHVYTHLHTCLTHVHTHVGGDGRAVTDADIGAEHAVTTDPAAPDNTCVQNMPRDVS